MILPQSIIDAIENPVILKNEHGVVLGCNQAFLRLRNIPRNKMIGFTAHDFLSQREADCHVQADKDLFSSEGGIIQYEYSQQLDGHKLAPKRNVYKSIINDSLDGARGILVVIEAQPERLTSMVEGARLTPRENAVLELLVLGNSQKKLHSN